MCLNSNIIESFDLNKVANKVLRAIQRGTKISLNIFRSQSAYRTNLMEFYLHIGLSTKKRRPHKTNDRRWTKRPCDKERLMEFRKLLSPSSYLLTLFCLWLNFLLIKPNRSLCLRRRSNVKLPPNRVFNRSHRNRFWKNGFQVKIFFHSTELLALPWELIESDWKTSAEA